MGVIVDGRRTRPVAFDMVMSDDVGHCAALQAVAVGIGSCWERHRRFYQQIYKGKRYLSI